MPVGQPITRAHVSPGVFVTIPGEERRFPGTWVIQKATSTRIHLVNDQGDGMAARGPAGLVMAEPWNNDPMSLFRTEVELGSVVTPAVEMNKGKPNFTRAPGMPLTGKHYVVIQLGSNNDPFGITVAPLGGSGDFGGSLIWKGLPGFWFNLVPSARLVREVAEATA